VPHDAAIGLETVQMLEPGVGVGIGVGFGVGVGDGGDETRWRTKSTRAFAVVSTDWLKVW
jgi:hypothetical protein